MTNVVPIELEGRHVRLVPLAVAHAAELTAAVNAARGTYGLQYTPDSVPTMVLYIEAALDEQARGNALPFAVIERATNAAVGCTRFLAIEHWTWPGPPPPPVPTGPDVVEIGATWYAERVQRTGVNTECKLLLCTHAFETWGVRRVSWKTDVRNTRSRAAIARLGARFDGILRAQKVGADGTVRDSAYFSMLRAEWPEAKAALAARLARGGSSPAARA